METIQDIYEEVILPYSKTIDKHFGWWEKANEEVGQNLYEEFDAYSYKYSDESRLVKCNRWIKNYVDDHVYLNCVWDIALDINLSDDDWDDIRDDVITLVRWEFAKRVLMMGE